MTSCEKEKLLEWVNSEELFSYTKSLNQSDTFTEQHSRFDIKIIYNGMSLRFEYQCNHAYMSPNKKDCLYSLVLDAYAYESSGDIDDFQKSFGYESVSECIRAYNGCKESYRKVRNVFTKQELNVLQEYFQDY